MSQALDPVTQHHVHQAAQSLAEEFAGIYSEETIERYIGESLDLLDGSRVNVFVPVLAHRFARERLKAVAQADGVITKDQPEVLFVCVHNAGRTRWQPGLWPCGPRGASTSAPPGARPPRRSTLPSSRRWPRSALTLVTSIRNRSRTTSSRPPTL